MYEQHHNTKSIKCLGTHNRSLVELHRTVVPFTDAAPAQWVATSEVESIAPVPLASSPRATADTAAALLRRPQQAMLFFSSLVLDVMFCTQPDTLLSEQFVVPCWFYSEGR